MLRKTVAILLLIVFVKIMLPSTVAVANSSFSDFRGVSAMLVELETETVLFEHNARTSHPADALTTVMTALLAVEAIDSGVVRDNELITMTEDAWHGLTGSNLSAPIQSEERMAFLSLIYASYLAKANEASNMIAIRVGGSIDNFVSMMNSRAREIGLTGTTFTNPTGQHDPNQVTTAYDQFLLFREALTNPLFYEIAGTFRHTTEPIDDIPSRTISNTNSLLNQGSRYFYRHSTAGAESSTFYGGRSLIAYAEEHGMSIIGVVLGAGEILFDDGSVDLLNFTEMVRLLHWGHDNFAWRDVLRTTDLLERVPILHGAGSDFVNVRPESALTLLLNNDVPTDDFARTITIYSEVNDEELVAPITAGTVLGEVVVTRNGIEYARIPLVANTSIELHQFEFIRRNVAEFLTSTTARNIYIILGLLLTAYLALLIRYHVIRANRARRIRERRDEIIRERHESFRE